MAKDKKTKAPQVEAPVVETAKIEEAPSVVIPETKPGLTQSEKLQFATELRHRVQELKEEDNPPMALIAGYNMTRDITFIDLAAGEIACGASATGYIFSGNEKAYEALQAAAGYLGVTLPAFKSLPAPTKSQLQKVGLTDVGNTKYLEVKSENVSAEAKKKKKAEKKLNDEAASGKKEHLTDHTKIEDDEQLKEALEFQLANSKITSPLDRLITAAQFYRSYLEARSDKASDPKAELARIHELTLADLLQEISTMVPASFTASGFGHLLCKQVATYQNIIPSFELLKRCGKNRKTGVFRFSDEETAAMVRVLVVWKASAKMAELSKDLKKLSENAEKNAKAIEQVNADIKAEQDLIACVTEPPYDVVDNLIVAYNDKENAMHDTAKAIVSAIIETHYKDIEIPELEFDTALLNIQQRAGMVLNLFNSPVGRRDDYSEDNLQKSDWESPSTTEEKTTEEKAEESKNA